MVVSVMLYAEVTRALLNGIVTARLLTAVAIILVVDGVAGGLDM